MKNPPLASGKQNITPEHPMKVQFLGAAQTVTGSCYVIETEQARFAVDCGLHQGNAEIEKRLGIRNLICCVGNPTLESFDAICKSFVTAG